MVFASGTARWLAAACATALFALGACGGEAGDPATPSGNRPVGESLPDGLLFAWGALRSGWRWEATAPDGLQAPAVAAVERTAHEEARRFAWAGGGEGSVSMVPAAPVDLSLEAGAGLGLLLDYRVEVPPTEEVSLWMACGDHCGGTVAIGGVLRSAPPGEWRTLEVPLRCLARAGLDPKTVRTPFALTTGGRLTLAISGVRIASVAADHNKCGAS